MQLLILKVSSTLLPMIGRKKKTSMKVEELKTYAHISVVTDTNGPDYPLIGQYRARIISENNYCFDHKGKAIWLTCDKGFEAMIAIDKIVSIKMVN